MQNRNKKADFLGEEKISKLIVKLSLPATIGMMVMVLYNVVDTIFVGRLVGAMAIAGISVVLPITMLISTIGMAIGIGGSSIISRALGSNNIVLANQTFGNLISLTIIISIAVLIPGYFFADKILFVFGAQGEIIPFAKSYFLIVLAGTPFLGFLMMSNNVIRSEGNAKKAMFVMLTSAFLNILFDFLFMYVFRWGIEGAAYATILSQILTSIYVIFYFARGKSALRYKRSDLVIVPKIVKETSAIGVTTLARHGANSVLAAILNHSLFTYGGEISVAVFGVINRVLMFSFFPLIGLVQGFLPIVGYNYGAKKFERLQTTLKLFGIYTLIVSVVGFFALYFFSENIIAIFSTDNELIAQGDHALQIIILSFSLIGLQMLGSSYYQAIGKALPALMLTLTRQFFCMIPFVLILPKYFGLDGIWYSFPLADAVSFTITLFFMLKIWRQNSNLITK